MRILALVTDAFGGHGGIAKFNRDFLTALCSHPSCSEVVAVPRLIIHSMEPFPHKLTYVTSSVGGKAKYVASLLNTVLRKSRFDLIVCGHINLTPIAVMARRLVQAPLLLVIHGIDAWQPTRSRLANALVRRIDAFVSVSECTRKRFVAWSRLDDRQWFLLPNTIEVERFGVGPKSEVLLDRYGLRGKKILITLGRLASEQRAKGFDEVLGVLPDLSARMPEIAYLIVGDGPDRRRLEGKAQRLGVRDRVIFSGFIPEVEKADHYRLADAYVMPSRGEGFGIVLLEAMASGIPVVASKQDASREALREGKLGILVDPGDSEDVMRGILQALERPVGVIPEGLEYFSFDNFEKRVHDIVDSMRSGG